MRAVVQRANGAQVAVDGEILGSFEGPGLVVLVGVTHDDTEAIAGALAQKVYAMRLFDQAHADAAGTCAPPGAGRELSASDLSLPLLVISQFTLFGDTRKGRRPTWDAAAPGPIAEPLVDAFVSALRTAGATVATGRFGADMKVTFTNDGPITMILDTAR